MIDLAALDAVIRRRCRAVRVVIAETKGSTPREVGAEMLIWADGRSGTIGGGRLELEAEKRAHKMLKGGAEVQVTRQPLGPALHQCCGGAVALVSEIYDAARLAEAERASQASGIWARPVEPGAGPLPGSAQRKFDKLKHTDIPTPTMLTGGWLIEPAWRTRAPVYIYGAGHVGRALATVLAGLPQYQVTLCDPRRAQFEGLAETITQVWDVPQAEVMARAPGEALHFIMTPDHDVDLELCHHLLRRDFTYGGLIGSQTKWARFQSRLKQLGHSGADIARITCPIGDPALGKHPQAIAVGITAGLLKRQTTAQPAREISA